MADQSLAPEACNLGSKAGDLGVPIVENGHAVRVLQIVSRGRPRVLIGLANQPFEHDLGFLSGFVPSRFRLRARVFVEDVSTRLDELDVALSGSCIHLRSKVRVLWLALHGFTISLAGSAFNLIAR